MHVVLEAVGAVEDIAKSKGAVKEEGALRIEAWGT